jgi:hypothetical protein
MDAFEGFGKCPLWMVRRSKPRCSFVYWVGIDIELVNWFLPSPLMLDGMCPCQFAHMVVAVRPGHHPLGLQHCQIILQSLLLFSGFGLCAMASEIILFQGDGSVGTEIWIV